MSKKAWIWITALLCAGFLLITLLHFFSVKRARAAENTLRAVYENAALSAIHHLDDLKWHIDKALLSQDTGASAQLLSQVSSGAAGVRQSMALLPVRDDGVSAALKFANQLEDYALMLEGTVTQGVSDSQIATLEKLSDACDALMQALTHARNSWDAEGITTGSRTLTDDQVAYPTLIYDGPFSDAQQVHAAATLNSLPEITREEALKKARDFLGDGVRTLVPGTDSFGPIPCYGVTAEADGVTLQMAVTRQGGKILWMFPEHGGFDMNMTVEACRQNALTFLENHGYAAMEPLHFEVYEGLAVINFAATQGSVLLYPDQVKVQVRMDTGDVIGLESRSYLSNHRPRGNLLPSVTREEAVAVLSGMLSPVSEGRLCLIPKGAQEVLCYEFRGTYREDEYLVYINADTLKQEEILKLVETHSGVGAV